MIQQNYLTIQEHCQRMFYETRQGIADIVHFYSMALNPVLVVMMEK